MSDTIGPGPSGAAPDDRGVKRARILGFLDAHDAGSVSLRSHSAISWYLEGARTHVGLAQDPIMGVIVDRERDLVIAGSNEASRLIAEELPGDVELETIRWDAPLADRLDDAALDERDHAGELAGLRVPLLPGEVARFTELSRDVAESLTDVAMTIGPASTERQVAARVAGALVARGIDPLVVLVGGDTRGQHRHPVPTASPIGSAVMLVVCGRRSGLVADATRWIRFGPSSSSELDRERRLLAVEAAFLDAISVGSTLAEVLDRALPAYAAHGFDPAEWTKHHQGGVAGYSTRDPRATPTSSFVVTASTAFAWNPNAPGAKVEDTVLFDGRTVQPLTVDPRWPVREVRGRFRPLTLER